MRLKKILFLTTLAIAVIFCFTDFVLAVGSTWSQNDWTGGADQNSWSDSTRYSSASGVSTSASGISLSANTNWYNTSWKYRQSIAVTNNSGVTLNNFQIPLYLNTAQLISGSKMKADCADIRIVDSNGTVLPIWVATAPLANTCNQATTKLWIKLSSLPTSGTTLYVYYGNNNASTVSNGNDVFSVFADFTSGSSLPNGWTTTNIGTSGASSVSNGFLTITNTNGEDVWQKIYGATHVYNTSTVNGSFIAETLINSQTNSDPWAKTGVTVQNAVSASVGNGYAFMVTTPGNGTAFQYQSQTGELCIGGSCEDGIVSPNAQSNGGSVSFPMFLKLTKNTSNQISGYFSSNGSAWTQRGSTVAPWGVADNQYVTLFITPHTLSGTSTSTYSFFYIRNYTTSEPTVGTPQNEQSPYLSSGYLISSVFDTGAGTDFGTLSFSYSSATNTTATIKVRTSDNSDMTGADDFTTCNSVVSGEDISANNCVTDRNRYVQYQIILSSSDNLFSPIVQSFDLNYVLTPTYTLNYTSGGNGSVNGSSTQIVFSGDSGILVSTTPETGYHFVDWSDGVSDYERTDTNVTENISVTANFAINTHTLSYTADSHGALSGSSTQIVNYGDNGSQIRAVANTGYRFLKWSDDLVTNPRMDLNISGNITVTATFELIPVSGSSAPIIPSAIGAGDEDITIGMNQTGNIGEITTGGINYLSYFNSNADFDTLVSRDNSLQNHHLIINDLDLSTNIVRFTIQSNPQIINLKIGDLIKIDLDNDAIEDIEIKFVNIWVNRVELTIKSLLDIAEVKAEYKPKMIIATNTYLFKRDLKLGMKGVDVKELQKYLNSNGFVIDSQGVGSPGKESVYFGLLTQKALIKFQKANDISPAMGYFGKITRGVVNK